jgi:hypothetical protein
VERSQDTISKEWVMATKRKVKMAADIRVYCDPELKRVAGAVALKEDLPLSELTAKALAAYVGRPDLAKIPRKSFGRPRKETARAS